MNAEVWACAHVMHMHVGTAARPSLCFVAFEGHTPSKRHQRTKRHYNSKWKPIQAGRPAVGLAHSSRWWSVCRLSVCRSVPRSRTEKEKTKNRRDAQKIEEISWSPARPVLSDGQDGGSGGRSNLTWFMLGSGAENLVHN